MRCPLILVIPNGEYPAGASGSSGARSARAKGIPTSALRVLLDLKTASAFKGLARRSDTGAADAEPIKNAAIDVTRVVLNACIAFSSRWRSRNQESRSSLVRFGEVRTIGFFRLTPNPQRTGVK